MTRCFLGFELTDASRAYLRERLEPLHRELARERHWPLRLVPPDNWHATLLFFPGLEAAERATVWEAVRAGVATGAWRDLRFEWQGLALWPSPRQASLMCLEAAPYPAAAQWPLTPVLEREPFCKGDTAHLLRYIPHVTVMRVRRGRDVRPPRPRDWEAVQPLLPAIEADAVRFDRVSFLLSTVSPAAPIYPREHTLALEG